jgi:hypothetical protein
LSRLALLNPNLMRFAVIHSPPLRSREQRSSQLRLRRRGAQYLDRAPQVESIGSEAVEIASGDDAERDAEK